MMMRPFGNFFSFFLRGALLGAHEMEGGDPFRSLMSRGACLSDCGAAI